MKLTVKRWVADQKVEEMAKYHLSPCFEYAVNNGIEYYADTTNDTVTFKVVEIVKETEKAIQVALETETKVGMNAHEPFNVWFPKSAIVK